MGRNRTTGIAVALGAAMALAAPAAAAAQTTEPVKTKYFFKCDGPAKVQNPTLITGTRSWAKEKPATSFTAGGGCGFFDSPFTGTGPETIYDGVFGGTHKGAVASAKVELHNLVLGRVTEQAFVPTLFVRLTVNGVEVVPEREIVVTPVVSSTGVSQSVTFALDGLRIPARSSAVPYILTVDSIGSAWVMDAAEVPASIELTEPAPVVTVPATATKAAKRTAKARKAAQRRAARR